MASEVKTNKVSPATGGTVTLGDASDVFQLPASAEIDIASGATLDVNGTIDVTGATTTGFPAGGMAGVQAYTSGSTWTKATRESALGITITKVVVEVQGAGGSGSAQAANYGSGGGGGFAKKLLDVSNTTTATATVGTGGAAKSANAGAGIAGGLSSFVELSGTGGWTDVVGNGGAGHSGSASVSAGGTATGGDINIVGGIGELLSPAAGGNVYGAGAQKEVAAGQGYGGGGSHGYSSYASGAGTNGIVIVWEYQ